MQKLLLIALLIFTFIPAIFPEEPSEDGTVKGVTPGKTKEVKITEDKVTVTKEDGSVWEMVGKPRAHNWQWKRVLGPSVPSVPQSGQVTPQPADAGSTTASTRPPFGPGIQPRFNSMRAPGNTISNAIEPWEVWWTRNREKYLAGFRQLVQWQEQKQEGSMTKFQIYDDLFNLLAKALEDKVENIAVMAALGLGKSGDSRAIPLLKKAYQDEKRAMVKDNILLALGLSGDASSINMIKEAVYEKKSDEVSRSYAAIALGYLNDPNVIKTLREILPEKLDVEVIASACLSLGNLRDNSRETIEALGAMLDAKSKKDRRIRCCAALGLGRIGTKEAFEELKKSVADKDDEVRSSIAIGLRLIPLAECKNELLTLIKDKNMMVRGLAAISLVLTQKTSSVADTKSTCDTLLKTLADTKRMEADGMIVLALGLLGDAQAGEELRKILKDKKSRSLLKGAAVVALGLLKDKEAGPILTEMLGKDENIVIKPYIALALGMLGDTSSTETLQKLWENVDKNINTFAYTNLAISLTLLGKKDEVVIPAMVKHAAKDQSDQMRMHALHTLGLLGNRTTAKAFIDSYDNEKTDGVRYYSITGAGFMLDRNPFPLINKVTADNDSELFMWTLENILPLPVW
ncbi:MAG: HEAT repeat domain-containing protein [Planctomycetes bacterium]|nr:HEAT repeat domain-containing protein [Planctomycetota bacterium]